MFLINSRKINMSNSLNLNKKRKQNKKKITNFFININKIEKVLIHTKIKKKIKIKKKL